MMHFFVRRSILIPLQLTLCLQPLLAISSDAIIEAGRNALSHVRGETASAVVSQVGSELYWSVNASINGQDVTVMLDTGSSDL